MSIVDEIREDREKGAKRLESEYRAGLMALARRFCADESDAAELVNRTFAAVVDNIDSYLEQSAFFGWMSRILINCHSKDIRRKSNEMEFCDAELPEDAPDDEACARIFREVDASILRDAIDRLPSDMKQTLMLHYFMDMPVKEVARVLSIPSGTVMWRLHYARKILGAKLGAQIRKKPVVALIVAGLMLLGVTAAVMVANEKSGARSIELECGEVPVAREVTETIEVTESQTESRQPDLLTIDAKPDKEKSEMSATAKGRLLGVLSAVAMTGAVLPRTANGDEYQFIVSGYPAANPSCSAMSGEIELGTGAYRVMSEADVLEARSCSKSLSAAVAIDATPFSAIVIIIK